MLPENRTILTLEMLSKRRIIDSETFDSRTYLPCMARVGPALVDQGCFEKSMWLTYFHKPRRQHAAEKILKVR